MKIKLTLILTFFISVSVQSQVDFEKGYFITNAGERTECLIKNLDWKNNPTEFEYKINENNEIKNATINAIEEFGIYNTSKYVKATVQMDRASSNRMYLSSVKQPIFNDEELLLEVLVEGKSNLYYYEEGQLSRYFFNVNESKIEQLVFKEYLINYKLGENNQFHQQLWTALKCPSITKNKIENLEYKKKQLKNLFIEFNSCSDPTYKNLKVEEKQNLIHLTLRPRLNNSSFESTLPISNSENADYGSKMGFGLGLEIEYILPFNNNKWSISIEPTYQSFKKEATNQQNNVSGGLLRSEIDYKSIEIPVSVRHYFFLNDSSKIFANLSYITDISLNSSINFTREDGSNFDYADINSGNNLAFGIGYKYNNNYSLELRYQTSRDLLTKYPTLSSSYTTTSLILGYTLF